MRQNTAAVLAAFTVIAMCSAMASPPPTTRHRDLKAFLRSTAGVASGSVPTSGPAGSLSVLQFGADPTGETDSTGAIQSAIDAAWDRSRGFQILNGSWSGPDMGSLVVDFAGGHYRVSAPLRFPTTAGGNLVFANGALNAAPSFPADGYLFQVDAVNLPNNRTFRYRYITWLNMELDGSHVAAGCIKMQQVEQIRFQLTRFLGFTRHGLWLTGVANECYVDLCWFQELPGYERCHDPAAKSGTAILLNSNDHSISNSVVLCAHHGVTVNNSANTIRNLHVYTEGATEYPNGALHVTSHAKGIRVMESYFDGCPVFLDDPSQVVVSDSVFLLAEGQASPGLAPVVITPTTPAFVVDGLRITGSVFVGSMQAKYPFVRVNTSSTGSLATTPPLDVVIADNQFNSWLVAKGLTPSATRFTLSQTTTATTNTSVWHFPLNGVLVFPSPPAVTLTVLAHTPSQLFVPTALAVVNTSLVEVRSAQPLAGATVTIQVEQSGTTVALNAGGGQQSYV